MILKAVRVDDYTPTHILNTGWDWLSGGQLMASSLWFLTDVERGPYIFVKVMWRVKLCFLEQLI